MADGVWLLDLDAGQTWRFATRAVTWDGNAYAAGLEVPDPEDVLALHATEPTEQSVPLTIWIDQLPDFTAAVMEQVLLGATGTLRWWSDPDGTAAPVTWMVGDLDEPEYGGRQEPITLSLREVPWEDRGELPALRARVATETWPNHDPGVRWERYPIVIGRPGVNEVGTPALIVDGVADQAVIADGAVAAATVTAVVNGVATAGIAVIETADALGRRVSIVDTTATAAVFADGDEVWIRWGASAGGLLDPADPTRALRGAGGVVEYLLRRSTLRVDWGRIRAVRSRLDPYLVDGYIQPGPGERVQPWGWLAEHVLPLLPVSVRTGPEGLYLAVFEPEVPIGQVRFALEARRNCDRISPVTVLGTGDVINDLSMAYAPRASTDQPTLTATLSGVQETLDDDSEATPSAICRESVRRYGARPWRSKSAVVYDRATILRVLRQRAATRALPPREVAYVLDLADAEILEPGDPVSLVDAEIGWTSRVAYVWAIRWAGATREVTLRYYAQPGRDYAAEV